MLKLGKALLIAAAFTATAANATLIDFTDLDLWGADRTPATVSYGDLDVTLTAYNRRGNEVRYTNRAYDGGNPCADYGGLNLQCEGDGIGIRDDEITYGVEMLQIDFSEAVDISAITFLDLFGHSRSDPRPEQATVVVTNQDGVAGAGIWEGTANNDRTGFFTATVENALNDPESDLLNGVTRLQFGAHYFFNNPYFSDFALAAIEVVSVPEPATFALLGLGLVSLMGARRQVKKTA